MRLSELLHEPVFDADARPIGRVHDVRLVQDGPLQGLAGAAFRVDALVVGRAGLGTRLGFHRHDMRGPWPLKLLFERLARKAHYVEWKDVAAWDDGRVSLRVRVDDLARLPDSP
ncbi:MAG TPA: hypothetical protein VGO92_04265 [Acidimicrobiales bacterium]|jgi:hypothetical protein|nr:hypothetical protein [Acidimicrobiales bacterium]